MLRTGVGAAALACVLFACSSDANDQATAMSAVVPASAQQPSRDPLPAAESLSLPSNLAAASAQGAAPLTFDSSLAYEHLRRQVGFGPRPAGSAALARCREYILTELAALGIEAREDAFEATTPLGAIQMVNVIATIPGRRTDRIALATHYDTKLFREFRFVGASDGASSTAAVLELARVLTTQQNEFTIELLFFDGEEAVVDWYRNDDNTYGSRRYVQMAQDTDSLDGLKALVLLDMIGDRDLTIRRDSNSMPWLTDIIWASAAALGYQAQFIEERTTIEDDHMPFVRAGIPSVDIIDLAYPAWHTAQDDLAHVSARSLQVVGDVVLHALPRIEQQLTTAP
jgi:glutaminyl-peptide cyclotransferase